MQPHFALVASSGRLPGYSEWGQHPARSSQSFRVYLGWAEEGQGWRVRNWRLDYWNNSDFPED
jgi:hypothetical protein